jgi:hypothetical protein
MLVDELQPQLQLNVLRCGGCILLASQVQALAAEVCRLDCFNFSA